MIYFKKYDTESGQLVAICDEELIGKKFKEGNIRLDLDTYASFYKGELIKEESAEALIDRDALYSANVVGKRAVSVLLKKGIADKKDVKEIEGVPFVQIFTLD
ncbi:MAG: DUF424 domain-containing protein [Candidatus Micrarchaeia archaeon]